MLKKMTFVNVTSSYYNARGLFLCLFVCLLPIQISTTVRFAAKRAMPAEGCLGHVLRGLACDYLPCGRRMCEVFLSQGTGEMPFLIDIMRSPVAGRNALKCSKMYR